ncbi:MAG: hypothetical protein J7L38_00870 [Thermoproteales archaeon]|nr:hypothetical protein [Thermoproteales archaeon]
MKKIFRSIGLIILLSTGIIVLIGQLHVTASPYIKANINIKVDKGFVVAKEILYSGNIPSTLTFNLPVNVSFFFALGEDGKVLAKAWNGGKITFSTTGQRNITLYFVYVNEGLKITDDNKLVFGIELPLAPAEAGVDAALVVDANTIGNVSSVNLTINGYETPLMYPYNKSNILLDAGQTAIFQLKIDVENQESWPVAYLKRIVKPLEPGILLIIDELELENYGLRTLSELQLKLPKGASIIEVRSKIVKFLRGSTYGGFKVKKNSNETLVTIYLPVYINRQSKTHLIVEYKIPLSEGETGVVASILHNPGIPLLGFEVKFSPSDRFSIITNWVKEHVEIVEGQHAFILHEGVPNIPDIMPVEEVLVEAKVSFDLFELYKPYIVSLILLALIASAIAVAYRFIGVKQLKEAKVRVLEEARLRPVIDRIEDFVSIVEAEIDLLRSIEKGEIKRSKAATRLRALRRTISLEDRRLREAVAKTPKPYREGLEAAIEEVYTALNKLEEVIKRNYLRRRGRRPLVDLRTYWRALEDALRKLEEETSRLKENLF